MRIGITKWVLYILLALIWGSSFELMKLGLFEDNDVTKPVLSAYQVAALRLLCAGIIILPLGVQAYKAIPKQLRLYAVLSGVLGSFLPAFLFCLAEVRLDASFAGMLNSLTPIFVVVVGFLFFQLKPNTLQVCGILVSFVGSIALFLSKSGQTGDLLYVGYILLATFLYGLNVNMVGNKLRTVPSIHIAALAFSSLIIPSGIVLYFTGMLQHNLGNEAVLKSIGASALLGVLGTTIASVLFYRLMKLAGPVFASAVTYGIPFVAIMWDVVHGVGINAYTIASLCIILLGIVVINYKQLMGK